MPAYFERLLPPATWYLVALGIIGSVFVAFVFVTSLAVATLAAALATVICAAVIFSQVAVVAVDGDGVLSVGRSTLAPSYRGAAAPLDAEQTRSILGAKADARAYLAVHGFCPTAVQVRVEDAADPHPYWVISTRQPRRLATALGWNSASTSSASHG